MVALLVMAGSAVFVFVPGVHDKAENGLLRLQSWWQEQQPHEMYVPPPPEMTDEPVALSTPVATPTPTIHPGSENSATNATATPTTRPTSTAKPGVAVAPAPAQVRLTNFKHDYQGWNNCGPTTLGMLLSHFGFSDTQKEIAPFVKPNSNDKNVSPEELLGYVHSKTGISALVRVDGSMELLKRLMANGIPVIVETWFNPHPNDGMGHYRLLFAYDDAQAKFFALDSYLGPNTSIPYDEFDADWKAFNRLYLVAFQPRQADLLNALMGAVRDDRAMWTQAKAHAQREIASNAADAFAWYNLGSSLGALGDQTEAAKAFDRARKIGLPWRMLWYQFQMFDSYLAVARYQDVLDLSSANLRQAADLEESYYYRGRALQAQGKTGDAIAAFREALRLNKNYQAAAQALEKLSG